MILDLNYCVNLLCQQGLTLLKMMEGGGDAVGVVGERHVVGGGQHLGRGVIIGRAVMLPPPSSSVSLQARSSSLE